MPIMAFTYILNKYSASFKAFAYAEIASKEDAREKK